MDEVKEKSAAQARVIQAIEEERGRLAREIHDGPAQILSNAVFELEYCDRILDRDPQALRETLRQLKGDIRAGLEEVRRFMFDLRPPTLTEQGLTATLRRHIQDYQARYGIHVDFKDDAVLDRRLSNSKEIAVFRIIQEALRNVYKHASANSVSVRLGIDNDSLHVVVADNGRGFDPESVSYSEGRHMGIIGMRERAGLVQGQLKIVSKPGSGTRVELSLPLDGIAEKV